MSKPANLAGGIVRPHWNSLAHGKPPQFAILNHAAIDSGIPRESATQRLGIRCPWASLTTVATPLLAERDFAGARLLVERALAIWEKMFGPKHPDTARSLHDLGTLMWAQGDLAAAHLLLERALEIREKVPGPEHSDTAT